MRHTLLPLNERIALRREYYVRVGVVACFILSTVFVVGIVSLFPTFIKTISMEGSMKSNSLNLGKESVDPELKLIQQKVTKSLALLDLLGKEDKNPKMTELIKGIIDIKGDIKFNNFSAMKTSTTTFTMSIQGVSPTRNSLLAFKDRYESLYPGNKIDLPVSELAKSSNISFSLQLKQIMHEK